MGALVHFRQRSPMLPVGPVGTIEPVPALLHELLELVPLIVGQNRLESLLCLHANLDVLRLRGMPNLHQLLPSVGKDFIYLLLLLFVEIKAL